MPVAVRTKRFTPKPAAPQADPRFQKVKGQVVQKASQLKKHPPAKSKATEAAKAAKGPPNEKAAGAKANQVDTLKDTKAETPPPDSFLATLRAEIEKVMPTTNEDAEKFMEGGAESEMKGAVAGNVKEQKDEASGDLQKNSAKPPNEGGVPTKQVSEIPPDPNVPVSHVNGGEGMPAPKPESEITEKQTKVDAQTALKENRLDGKRIENKDPRFAAVKAEKGNVDKVADASPNKYRAGEKQTLGKAAMQANVTARTGMTALTSVKNKSKSAVKSRQDAQKQKDEQRRKAVTDRIEAIYTETKIKVDTNLNSLERDVMAIFDPGCSSAIASFKANTNREIDDFYDERYSGISGKLDWIADKFKDTPPRVKQIIQENLVRFTASMDALAVRVAGLVDKRLNKAKADIDAGQAKIKAFVASLPKDLKAVGQEAEKAMESRFNEMRNGVESKKNDLAQKLAQKYKEAHDQANELAKKIEEENKGAFKKLADAIGEVIKIILEFKDKLMAILKKAADAIELILDDPIGFLSNLLAALKKGFFQFKENILKHLEEGFMAWLFGNLASAGIELPKDLSLPEILKLVLSVLGLTPARIEQEAVKLLGPTAVAVIKKLIEYVKVLIQGGPAKLWEQIKQDIGDLKAMVIDAIQKWLIETIVKQAVIKIVSMFNPAGAFIQACIAIYNVVVFVIERASQIMAFVEAVINSVHSIATGAIDAAANWIEKSLARLIPLVISFLARLIGLGGISQKIKEFITKVQNAVWGAIRKVLKKIVDVVKKLFGKTKPGEKDNQASKDIKKKVKAELSGKKVTDAQQASTLISSIYSKFSKDGLKGIRLIYDPKKPKSATVKVSASIAEEIANLPVQSKDDAEKLIDFAWQFHYMSSATSLYVYYDSDNKSFGPKPIKNKSKKEHAEQVFFQDHWPGLKSQIAQMRSEGKLKTPKGQSVRVTLNLNRLPCPTRCAGVIAGYAGANKGVTFVVQAASKSNEASLEVHAEYIADMIDKGVIVEPLDVWTVIQKKLGELVKKIQAKEIAIDPYGADFERIEEAVALLTQNLGKDQQVKNAIDRAKSKLEARKKEKSKETDLSKVPPKGSGA
jgi:hypothetical protein